MKLSKAQKISTSAFSAVNRSSRISLEVFPHLLWLHDSGTSECCVSCCSTWWCLWWCRCWLAESLSRLSLGILTDPCSAQTPHTTACYQVSCPVPFPILKHIPCLRKKGENICYQEPLTNARTKNLSGIQYRVCDVIKELTKASSGHLCAPQWPHWSCQKELSWSGFWIELRKRN